MLAALPSPKVLRIVFSAIPAASDPTAPNAQANVSKRTLLADAITSAGKSPYLMERAKSASFCSRLAFRPSSAPAARAEPTKSPMRGLVEIRPAETIAPAPTRKSRRSMAAYLYRSRILWCSNAQRVASYCCDFQAGMSEMVIFPASLACRFMAASPRKRPNCCAAAKWREGPRADAIDHSITSSVSAISVCGTVSPSARAVFMLMTKSNFVGNCTGKSTVDVPRNILST